jgi:uncharacterized membrane protein
MRYLWEQLRSTYWFIPMAMVACAVILSTASVLLDRAIPGIVDAAFNQIRQHATSSVVVTIRLLEAIAIIAVHTRTQEQKSALRHVALVLAVYSFNHRDL